MAAANPLHNLFVRCPDGQLICLNNVDVATETSSDLKRRIVQKWQPNDHFSVDAGTSTSLLLLRFLAFVGIMAKLQSVENAIENEMYLSYSGKPLVESHCNTGTRYATSESLAKYNLRSDATIHAAIRVRGGCFMVSLSILCIIVGGEYHGIYHACMLIENQCKHIHKVEFFTFLPIYLSIEFHCNFYSSFICSLFPLQSSSQTCVAMMMSVFTCGGSLIIIPFLAPFLFILPFFCL